MFARVDHIGVAVDDLDAALALYGDALQMPVAHRRGRRAAGVSRRCCSTSARTTSSSCARSAPDTPVGKFLAGRGPGLHHVAYQVQDIEAALDRLREQGVRLIDEQPRVGIRGSLVAFVHPKASNGVLTEIVQPAEGLH
jgi:methylmalonyl-CoA epimerase